jgi:hypothetical protein
VIELLALGAVLTAATGMGRRITLRFCPIEDLAETFILSAGIGMGILGYAICFIGLMGWLYPWVMMTVVAATLLLFGRGGAVLVFQTLKACWAERGKGASDRGRDERLLQGVLLVVFVVVFVVTFLKAFVPTVGSDPLAYHLPLPKRFLESHRIVYLPYMATSVFPLFTHMFYVLALSFGDTSLAQLFHCSFGVITFFTIYAFARGWIGARFAFLSSAVFLATPGIFHQMPSAQNDVSVTCFQFLQLFCLWKWVSEKKLQWTAFAGIFAGLSLSVKFTAVGGCFAAFWVLIFFGGRPWGKTATAALLFCVWAVLCCAVWYGRSFYYTGNPVYPYFPELFGGGGQAYDLVKHGAGKSVLDFFLAPLRMTIQPERFGGRGNQFGPIFLLTVPFLAILRDKDLKKPVLFLLSYLGILYTVWFLGAQNLRFLFSALPPLSFLVGIVFYTLERSPSSFLRRGFKAILTISLSANALLAVYYLRDDWKMLVKLESRDTYLRREERSFGIASQVNRELPPESKILSQEVRVFYFRPVTIHYNWLFKETDQFNRLPKEEIVPFLRQKGFTHLLLVEGKEERDGKESIKDDNFGSLLNDAELRAKHLKTVLEQVYTPPGALRSIRYIVAKIQ